MKKLFGGIDMTWKKVILFAVITGVYTGVMMIFPALKGTSFQNIGISFEAWILFAILIIVNSKTPLDSALKVFVFFLISQPLVYLVQVPFFRDGFGIFRYYPSWFVWTLLTFPMAFVGHFMKKDKWWGLLILAPMMVLLGSHLSAFFGEMLIYFPKQLLSVLFCAATLVIYPVFIFREKKIKTAGLILALVILAGSLVLGFATRDSHIYNTSLLSSGGETSGIEYDDTYEVYLEDPSFGEVRIGYEQSIETYMVYASFRKTGDTVLVLKAPDGTAYEYDITVGKNTYDIRKRE